MKLKEIILENKKQEAPKPRNFVAKNAMMGGAGQHKDAKRAKKQGNVKHKKDIVPMEEVAGPEKCWPGHRKVGTKPGTGKNAGKRVNDCEKIKEQGVAEGYQSAKTIEQIKFWYKDAADAVEMAKAAEALNVNGMYDEAIKKYKHQAQISLSKANSLKQGVAEGYKEERLKGCKCQHRQGDNKKCPIHGVQEGVAEGAVKDLMYDLKTMSDEEFQSRYKMTKADARANLKKKDETVAEMRGFRGVGGSRSRENDENEKIDAMLRQQDQQRRDYEQTGKFWLKQKDTQQHISKEFTGKAAANKAALELLKQQPELKGNLLITAYGPGEK